MYTATQNCPIELYFYSGTWYDDPFNQVDVDVLFEGEEGERKLVPAFWAGENIWKVRFSASSPGRYQYRSICSDEENKSLHNQKGTVLVVPYEGDNPLFKHGPLKVSKNRRYLEHCDGTPFFWLGDTWWMGLCKRLSWPQDFNVLTQDRVKKGFSVIQIVVGPYPDLPPFDERGANEAGLPWKAEYTRINPAYFDMADLRIGHLVNSGLVPCIFGSWGYYLPWMGVEKLKKHWRYLIARYGAYPVIWCLAGEALMPYYLSTSREEEIKLQRSGWTEIARYVREKDPYHHPVTIHPAGFSFARDQIEDPSLLDFEMIQTAHGDWWIVSKHMRMVIESVNREPKMPSVVGEACYEGHGGTAWEDMQRFLFWSSILSGCCGYTYGADGVFQVNTRTELFGPSAHGGIYSEIPWNEAYQFPGSMQVGIAKKFLTRYPWWEMEPHPEWVKSCWNPEKCGWERDEYLTCYAAGIPRKLRIIYFPFQRHPQPVIQRIEEDVSYKAFYFDPKTGKEYHLGKVKPNTKGEWIAPPFPLFQDGVLVLEQHKR